MSSLSATQETILIADPRVIKIPVHENHDKLINLKEAGGVQFGPSPEVENNTDYTYVRASVYARLIEAQKLLPKGYKLCLYEGYRSIVLQSQLFAAREKTVREAHPDWDYPRIFAETTKLVSPIINLDGSKNIPPHSTGGAIDVYLIDDNGEPYNMGIHPKDWMTDIKGDISKTNSDLISPEASQNREIMSKALIAVGFVNYPTEYWHWSYGDRYWAYHKNEKYALFNSVEC